MCWLGVLVLALILVRRIPHVLRTHPRQFAHADPETFDRWRSKSLWAIGVFLAFVILVPIGLVAVSQAFASDLSSGRIRPTAMLLIYGLVAAFIFGLAWAFVLQMEAWSLRRAMSHPKPPETPANWNSSAIPLSDSAIPLSGPVPPLDEPAVPFNGTTVSSDGPADPLSGSSVPLTDSAAEESD